MLEEDTQLYDKLIIDATEIISEVNNIEITHEKARKKIVTLVANTIDEQLRITNDNDLFIKTFASNLNQLKTQIDVISDSYDEAIMNKTHIENWMKSVQIFLLKI